MINIFVLVTILGHFKKIYGGQPEMAVRRNILHDLLDLSIIHIYLVRECRIDKIDNTKKEYQP